MARRPSTQFFLSFITFLSIMARCTAAGGVGISTVGDNVDTLGAQVGDTSLVFIRYKVPPLKSALANRDLEFLWSPTYLSRGKPLATSDTTENDLDRLGKSICDSPPSNPFNFNSTDIRLVHDYLVFGNYTYNTDSDPSTGPGFIAPTLAYDTPNRSHADTYLYAPKVGADPGDSPDLKNRGHWPSDFTSRNEDVSTGRDSTIAAVLGANSVSIAGPDTSLVGKTDATRWTRPDAGANYTFDHEFQHMLNQGAPAPASIYSEIWSSAAEALAGEIPETPRFDVPYTWSPLRIVSYQAWRSLTSYLAYNFRGTDTTFAGRSDDLVWRWARGSEHTLVGLGARLSGTECAECASKTYFAGLSGQDRLQVLLHNWRVANFVDSDTLGRGASSSGPYGFSSARFHFSPSRDVGNWQNIDGVTADDDVAVPPDLYATPTWRTREVSLTKRPGGVGFGPRPLSLEMFGAEYFVIHADPALAATGQDLMIRVAAESLFRENHRTQVLYNPPDPTICREDSAEGKLFVSVVAYTRDTTDLFRHPEWAAGVVTRSAVLDSLREEMGFQIAGFGGQTKAVVVVASLQDGPHAVFVDDLKAGDLGICSGPGPTMPMRLSLTLRPSGAQGQNPTALAARAACVVPDRQ